MVRKKTLRSGYTTGACAAAAAKAATLLVMRNALCVMSNGNSLITHHSSLVTDVEIPFPDGSRAFFAVHASGCGNGTAWASVIKDAGDDPDVTNGAEIVATVTAATEGSGAGVLIKGGRGVGLVTKPGLPVPVGEPAINPVPRKMIEEAIREGARVQGHGSGGSNCDEACPLLEVTISVPDGKELAKKTLNERLGIVGGISILGTTGIVRPVSAAAWTATISSSMDVAKAMGREEIVLSAGRASEKAHMKKFRLPEECYVMMGDYLEYSLREAKHHGFRQIHLAAQWAKMLKIALGTPQTHVRHGAISLKSAIDLLCSMGYEEQFQALSFNTAREILDGIRSSAGEGASLLAGVCDAARRYSESVASGVPVAAHLVSYEGEIIAGSE